MKTKQIFAKEFLAELTEALANQDNKEIEELRKVVIYSFDMFVAFCSRHIDIFKKE